MAEISWKEKLSLAASLALDIFLDRMEEIRCVSCGDTVVIPRTVSKEFKKKFETGFCSDCATVSLRDPD